MKIDLISSTMDEYQYLACFQTFYAYDGFRVLDSNINKNDHLFQVITQFNDDRDLEDFLLSYCKNTPQYRVKCCEKAVNEITLEDMRGIRIYLPAQVARCQPQLRPYMCSNECKTWVNILDYGCKGMCATYRYSNYYSLHKIHSSNQYRFLSLFCI